MFDRESRLQPHAGLPPAVLLPADVHLPPVVPPLRPGAPPVPPVVAKFAVVVTLRPVIPANRSAVGAEPVPIGPGAPHPVSVTPKLVVMVPARTAIMTEFAFVPVNIAALGPGGQRGQGEQQDQTGQMPVTHGRGLRWGR